MIDLFVKKILYYLLFTAVLTIFLWYFDKRLSNKFETKTIEIDGKTYFITDLKTSLNEPKKIKNLGTELVCSSLSDILGKKIYKNKGIERQYSIVTGDEHIVDCYEKNTKIAADYIPEEVFNYEGISNYNKDVYEFYDRLAILSDKKQKLINNGYNYIEVPYTVDKYDNNNDPKIRQQRIKDYISKEIKRLLS